MEGCRERVKERGSPERRKSGREGKNCIWVESGRVVCIFWGLLWEDEHWSSSSIFKKYGVCLYDQNSN